MSKRSEEIIEKYLEAFKLANPGKGVPVISQQGGGWYRIHRVSFSHCRLKEIEERTARLLSRALNKPRGCMGSGPKRGDKSCKRRLSKGECLSFLKDIEEGKITLEADKK